MNESWTRANLESTNDTSVKMDTFETKGCFILEAEGFEQILLTNYIG